jgi:hypothetical protein
MNQSDIDELIKDAVREERDRCLAQVEREKQTWHVANCSRAVRTACDNIKAMIRGEM